MAAKETPAGEETEKAEEVSPERQLALRTLRIQQSSQDSRKNAQETQSMAESFDDIRREFINNRIDTDEIRQQLGPQIADPLHHVAEKMFPELENDLEALEAAAADPQQGPEHRDAAVQKVNDILVVMEQVLSHMHTLEDYNELVKTLEGIYTDSEKIQKQIDDIRKQRARARRKLAKENWTWPFSRNASWRPASAGWWQWSPSALERRIRIHLQG